MIYAKTLGLRIIPAAADYRQHVKGGSTAHYYRNGSIHRRNGCGGEWVITPTRLVLIAETADGRYDVRVDTMFREEFGRITQKRIKAICGSIPPTVCLEKYVGYNGNSYFNLSSESFEEWLSGMR